MKKEPPQLFSDHIWKYLEDEYYGNLYNTGKSLFTRFKESRFKIVQSNRSS